MGTFRITVVNNTFKASDDHELATIGEANREALKGALQIGVDEVCGGMPFFGAEVRVEDDGEVVSRFVVSIGASPLQ